MDTLKLPTPHLRTPLPLGTTLIAPPPEIDVDFRIDINETDGDVISGYDAVRQRIGLLLSDGYTRECYPAVRLAQLRNLIFSPNIPKAMQLPVALNELGEVLKLVEPTMRIQKSQCYFVEQDGHTFLMLALVDTRSNTAFNVVL